jgi:hypothetical protein
LGIRQALVDAIRRRRLESIHVQLHEYFSSNKRRALVSVWKAWGFMIFQEKIAASWSKACCLV